MTQDNRSQNGAFILHKISLHSCEFYSKRNAKPTSQTAAGFRRANLQTVRLTPVLLQRTFKARFSSLWKRDRACLRIALSHSNNYSSFVSGASRGSSTGPVSPVLQLWNFRQCYLKCIGECWAVFCNRDKVSLLK